MSKNSFNFSMSMPSAIANTTHINIMKYMFYPPFRQPGRPCCLPGHHCKKRWPKAPTRYYRLVIVAVFILPFLSKLPNRHKKSQTIRPAENSFTELTAIYVPLLILCVSGSLPKWRQKIRYLPLLIKK